MKSYIIMLEFNRLVRSRFAVQYHSPLSAIRFSILVSEKSVPVTHLDQGTGVRNAPPGPWLAPLKILCSGPVSCRGIRMCGSGFPVQPRDGSPSGRKSRMAFTASNQSAGFANPNYWLVVTAITFNPYTKRRLSS